MNYEDMKKLINDRPMVRELLINDALKILSHDPDTWMDRATEFYEDWTRFFENDQHTESLIKEKENG